MQSTDLTQRIQLLRRHLPQNPVRALELLPTIPGSDERRKLAILIAQSWAPKDINTAWNAVARSALSATDKQIMFNELWG
jgi:hypothetical protein